MELNNRYKNLSKKAEKLLKDKGIEKNEKYYDDIEKLVEELNIHQIELEMQNQELQETNQKLENEQKRYKELYHMSALFDKIGVPILLIHPDTGQITDANPAASTFYGYRIEELKAMNIAEINQLTESEVKTEIENTRKSGKKYFNFKHKRANGDIRDVEVYSGPLRMHGELLLYLIIHDITAQREAEATLRQALEKLN